MPRPILFTSLYTGDFSCFKKASEIPASRAALITSGSLGIQDQIYCIFVISCSSLVAAFLVLCPYRRKLHQHSAYDLHMFQRNFEANHFPSVGNRIRIFSALLVSPVIEDFFVWTRWNAMSPTAAYILRYKYNTIFITFVDSTGWTCSYTCRVQAVVTKTW